MKVLTITSHYLPGFKAGGPVRSVANLVEQLGGECDFHVLTRDRDLGDDRPFEGMLPNAWQPVGLARVMYLRHSAIVPFRIARAVRDIQPDLLYFNSFFDALWCLAPLSLLRSSSHKAVPIVIAPRGQFGEGAMRIRTNRKKAYLAAFRALNLTNRVTWQATSACERDDILRHVGRRATVIVAPNLSDAHSADIARSPKQTGNLRLVFYSRVSPKKNLLSAIELLRTLPGNVSFDICGPVEDRAYEQRCRQQIATLPGNVEVQWRGPVAPTEVAETLAGYDAMLLPTLGENFGHAIIESLAAGCPAVISDRTPWRNLAASGAGWDLPLDSPTGFEQALSTLASLDEHDHQGMRTRAAQFAREAVNTRDDVEAHRQLLRVAINGQRRPRQAA